MCNDDTVNELKKDFHYTLSKFSHEIRNPLTLINSGLQMIASAHPEVEDYEHWDDVMDNLSYVRELLDELSAFNNAGRVKPEATDTGMYLKTVLSSVKPTLDYLDIRLVTDIPNDLPTLMLDRIQIRQMILNLLKKPGKQFLFPADRSLWQLLLKNLVFVSIFRIMDVEFPKNSLQVSSSRFLQQKKTAPVWGLLFPDR